MSRAKRADTAVREYDRAALNPKSEATNPARVAKDTLMINSTKYSPIDLFVGRNMALTTPKTAASIKCSSSFMCLSIKS